eukprot:s1216_g5.t1
MPVLLVSLLSLLPWLGQGQPNVSAPFVVASLEAIPSTAQACSELVFSGSKSTESRGEPLQYFWGFGPGTPSWFRIPLLAGILEEATAQSMSTIIISPAILSRAGSALKDLREGEVRLEVRLTVRNDLGNSTETVASANIIGLTSQAEPAVSAIGATEITMPHSDELRLAVSTREASFALQCADRNPGTSAGRTNVTWHYRSSNQLAWQSLDASPSTNGLLRDLAKDPNKVHLAPLAFQPGTFHLFRAVAAFDMRPTLAPRPHVVFRVAVEPLPQVRVYIIGPRLASRCDFELEAEVWDPVRPTAAKEEFQFSWICSSVVQVGEHDACAQLPQFGADFPKTDGTGGRGSKIRVVSGQLPAGMHRFSVIARRASGGPESIARKAVQVNSSFFAPLRLQFPSYGYSGIVQLADGVPQVSAFMDLSSTQCATPTGVQWRWFLVEDRLTAVVERALSTTYDTSGGLLHLRSGSGGQLTAGVPYFHVLLQSEDQEMLDQVLNENRPALDSVLQNGVAIAAQSPKFVADQAPLGGSISVMPGFKGLSLRTTFRIDTAQWQDEDLLSLEYEFLTFPFQAINQSAQDLGIDWEDPDSDSFWMKLGGRRFRLFDRSPQAFLQAPPGSHSIVVRARDVRGSISVISSSMPLVVDAEHNFSVPDATIQKLKTFRHGASQHPMAWGGSPGCILFVPCLQRTETERNRCLSGLGTNWIGSRLAGVQNGDVRMVGLAASKKAAIEEAEKTLEEFKEMKKDYEKMRTRPQPRNGKRVGNEVWFDVKLSPPLGLALDTSVDGEAVGVSEVVEGGSAFEYNKNCLREDADEKRIWIQPGDRVLMVNGVKTKTTEEVVGVVSKMKEGEKVVLKISRQARGPIQVVFPEPADPVVVRGSTKLVDAARAAGHEVIYRCEDGLCGSCWHVSELTGDIYQLILA